MEIWVPRVQTCLVFLLLWLPVCFGLPPASISNICWRPRLEDSAIFEDNQCPIDYEHKFQTKSFSNRGVLEVNGTDLERSLLLLNTRDSVYAAVLVYARWCPFSRALLPVFDSLSSSFPSIYHFTVEESALQRSAFSNYGVNSFPVLFLHNKTAKVRYQGKRTLDAITKFYKDCSGMQPVIDPYKMVDRAMSAKVGRLRQLSSSSAQEEKLHDDVYLILSLIFLLSRGLFSLWPKLSGIVKHYWAHKNMSWQAYGSLLHGVVFGTFQRRRGTHAVSKGLKGKGPKTADFTQERGKVLLSVPGWPSSSLAAVSLAEGSGSRHGVKGGDI